jgi:hypothetical protein
MSIEIIDKLKQKNNGTFKLIDLEDVDYDGTGTSTKDKIEELVDNQITLVEDDTSMEGIDDTVHDTLTTQDKTLIGAINEVNSQCKDIENMIINFEPFRRKYSKNNDDTPAFIAVMEYIKNISSRDIFANIRLKSDVYYVHEINNKISNSTVKFMIESDNTRSAIIEYNGDGGDDSYLFDINDISFGGFRNITLSGWNKNNNRISKNIIKVGAVDHLSIWENIQFRECLGDAIHQTEGAGFANWYIDRVRFDSIGGYSIYISCNDGMENRPFKISNFTVDNLPRGGFKEALKLNNIYNDEKYFGKGFIFCNKITGASMSITKGRIEYNTQIEGESYLLYEANTTVSGRVSKIDIDNVDISTSKPNDNKYLIVSENNSPSIYVSRCNNGAKAIYYDKKNNKRYGKYGSQTGIFRHESNVQNTTGICFEDRRIEFKTKYDVEKDFSKYKFGDILISNNMNSIVMQCIYQCIYPKNGYGIGANVAIGNGVSLTTNTIQITSIPARLDFDDCIILTNDSKEIECLITDIDYTNKILTLNKNTLIENTTYSIKHAQCIFRLINGECDSNAPTTGTWNKGEKVWNKDVGAGKYIGWVCISSGTPGTWKGFGLIES